MSDLTGATFGDYRVDTLLGPGRLGQVYRASHVYLGTPVALEMIDAHLTGSPGFKTRLVQYAQAITGVSHPNVVRVFHLVEEDGRFYVVMELIAGDSLAVVRPDSSMSAWTQSNWSAVGLLRQAADGVAAAHARGITHGALKLSNLLVTKADAGPARVKVSELGVSRLLGGVDFLGAGLAPPAQASELAPGHAEDVKALGALLYEVTTGRSPLALAAAGAAVGAHARAGARPAIPQPRDLVVGLPEPLEAIILRSLTSDPATRFASCAELSSALGRLLDASRQEVAEPAVRQASPAARQAAPAVRQASPAVRQAAPSVAPKPIAPAAAAVRRSATPPKPPEPPGPGRPKMPSVHVFDEAGHPLDMQYVRGSGIVIGRSADCGIVLPGDDVSPTHARIDWDSRRVTVTDLGSASNTLMQRHRLLPQVAQEWAPEQWLQVGPYWLWLQTPSTDQGPLGGLELMIDPQGKVMTLTPGRQAMCRAVLVNQKTQVDHVLLSVEGIPEDWVEGTKRDTQLQPFEKREVTLTINVPKSPAGRAGDYMVTIHARSSADPDAEPRSATAHWTVLPFDAMSVSIAPGRAGGRTRARYTVTLHHEGNKPASYVLTGSDEEKQLECLFSTEGSIDRNRLTVDVKPGTRSNVKLKVVAPKRWFGSANQNTFTVHAAPGEGQPALVTDAQFTHRPIVPLWLLAVAPIVLIGLLYWGSLLGTPVVNTVYVEPRNPTAAQKVEIFWDSPKATRIRLLVNDLPVLPDPDVAQGKYVFPEGFEKDTRVRVLASNLFGEAAREVTVTVRALPPAPPAEPAVVELFEVRPLTIAPDQEVAIRWRVKDAVRVELNPLGSVDVEGSTTHSPAANQTYALTAFNRDNQPTTRTLMVQVRAPQVAPNRLALEASSTSGKADPELHDGMLIGVGQSVVFKWEAANAQKVRIDAISPVSLEGGSGQKTAQLKGEGTYAFILVASNDRGQEFRSKPVHVRASCKSVPARLVTFKFGCNKNPEVQWK